MNIDIHRLLDEAFRGVEMTPDAQDLKEEVRANLVARVDELESSGVAPGEAARRAIAELGDVRELVGETDGGVDAVAPAGTHAHSAAFLRYRVRPRAGFVVRVVVWSVLVIAGTVLAVCGAVGWLALPVGVTIAMAGAAAIGVGLIVGDSLMQETTTNHPMPTRRAASYGVASFLGVLALGFGGLVAASVLPMWGIAVAAVPLIASIIVFSFLGATQTNRHKAWVRDAHRAYEVSNRFEDEPETAARFGMYTAVIWIVTFAIMVVLGFTVGWWWAPLAFVGGFAAMMLVLARMMFGPRKTS